MTEKVEEPISQVCGWVNSQTAITVARLYSHIIHGSQLPSSLWYQEPYWYSG